MVKPFLDNTLHGIFAARSPARPNPIGISIVQLKGIENNILHIQDIDIVDGTPLLDIKPYVPKFDNRKAAKIGWFNSKIKNWLQPETTADSAESSYFKKRVK